MKWHSIPAISRNDMGVEGGRGYRDLSLAGRDTAWQFLLHLQAGEIHALPNTVLAIVCIHAGGQEDDCLAELIRSQMYLVKHEFLQARQHSEKRSAGP